ncbi:MAG: NAD(P)/FAD-dependent oxidoreductase [Promethearchaeota archaeon]
MPNLEEYDVVIIGTGPAGISAAIYTQRYELRTLLIGLSYGGAIARTHVIENYPGYASISGLQLVEKFRENLNNLGVELIDDNVKKISKIDDNWYQVEMDYEGTAKTRAIIFATGAQERKLGVPGEEEFQGRGVSYCATCDGPFYKGKILAVVGGSDSAAKEALYLSDLAEKVIIIYRGEKIHPEPINLRRIEAAKNIEIINKTLVEEILGDDKVNAVKLNNGQTLEISAIFIEIGADPRSQMAHSLGVEVDEKGYIKVDEQMKTNVPGLFAAGDVVNRREKQVVVAAGHGAIAAFSVKDYIDSLKSQ